MRNFMSKEPIQRLFGVRELYACLLLSSDNVILPSCGQKKYNRPPDYRLTPLPTNRSLQLLTSAQAEYQSHDLRLP